MKLRIFSIEYSEVVQNGVKGTIMVNSGGDNPMARYVHTTDAKGRIFIPARLRESLGGVVYVTKSLDKGYLTLYTTDQFESVREQLNQLSGTDPVARFCVEKYRRSLALYIGQSRTYQY